MATIDCAELFQKLGDDDLLVLDCRDEREWDVNPFQIPGTLKLSVRELREAADSLPDDELIVLVGTAQDSSDVLRAFRILRRHKRQALILEGGLLEWIEHGLPTECIRPRGGFSAGPPLAAAAEA